VRVPLPRFFPSLAPLEEPIRAELFGIERLEEHPQAHLYRPGGWGPKQADALIAADGRWHNPTVAPNDCS
jgi:hypothetical protein